MWKECRGVRRTRFLLGDKDRAPCSSAIVSERKQPIHHPAHRRYSSMKIIIEAEHRVAPH